MYQQSLVTGCQLPVRDQQAVIAGQVVIHLGIEVAALLALDH